MEEEETLLDVQHSPLFKLKRRLLMMSLFLNFFLVGLEYSITIPPAFFNGKYSSADRQFMLLEVGFYPMAAMISSLILGHVYDRTKRIRNQLIVMNFLQVIGNYIYAINYSRWLPLLGRIISGAGDGFTALAMCEITYLYEEHNRVGMVCLLELGRVLGFLMGPIINFFIIKWTIHHNWELNSKTLPSYVMGCSWAAMLLITFVCVHNLALEVIEKFNLNDSPFLSKKTLVYNAEKGIYENPEETDDDEIESEEEEVIYDVPENPFLDEEFDEEYKDRLALEKEKKEQEKIEKENADAALAVEENSEKTLFLETTDEELEKDEFQESADKIFPVPKKKKVEPKKPIKERIRAYTRSKIDNTKRKLSCRVSNAKTHVADKTTDIFQRSHLSEIMHLEFALIMVVNFLFWFSQTTFCMFCTYVTTYEYHWGPIEIGLTYIVGFSLIIAMFLIMYFLREGLLKRNIYFLIVAMALLNISLGLLIYEKVPPNLNHRMIVFIITAVLVFASIPLSLVCYKTLLTSLVRPGLQGSLQGISAAIVRLALIAGLLLSIVIVSDRQVYGSVMTAFCFVTIILFFLTFDNIVRKQRESAMSSSF